MFENDNKTNVRREMLNRGDRGWKYEYSSFSTITESVVSELFFVEAGRDGKIIFDVF